MRSWGPTAGAASRRLNKKKIHILTSWMLHANCTLAMSNCTLATSNCTLATSNCTLAISNCTLGFRIAPWRSRIAPRDFELHRRMVRRTSEPNVMLKQKAAASKRRPLHGTRTSTPVHAGVHLTEHERRPHGTRATTSRNANVHLTERGHPPHGTQTSTQR